MKSAPLTKNETERLEELKFYEGSIRSTISVGEACASLEAEGKSGNLATAPALLAVLRAEFPLVASLLRERFPPAKKAA